LPFVLERSRAPRSLSSKLVVDDWHVGPGASTPGVAQSGTSTPLWNMRSFFCVMPGGSSEASKRNVSVSGGEKTPGSVTNDVWPKQEKPAWQSEVVSVAGCGTSWTTPVAPSADAARAATESPVFCGFPFDGPARSPAVARSSPREKGTKPVTKSLPTAPSVVDAEPTTVSPCEAFWSLGPSSKLACAVKETAAPVAGSPAGARKTNVTVNVAPLGSEPNEQLSGRAGGAEQLPVLGAAETYVSGNGVVEPAGGALNARWVTVFVSPFEIVAVYA